MFADLHILTQYSDGTLTTQEVVEKAKRLDIAIISICDNNLEEFINHLKSIDNVVGIVEYGGRKYTDMSIGGDYDLTVIFDKPISENFSGIHFHVAGIPIDCMLLSVEDFKQPFPSNPFMFCHLNSRLLYDKGDTTKKLLHEIQTNWKLSAQISISQASWFRFGMRHTIDKLEHRLFENILYSRMFISSSANYAIECYATIKGLEVGKTKSHLQYMKENDPIMYSYFNKLFDSHELELQFEMLKKINAYVVKDIGGMWAENEVLFHILPEGENDLTEQEKMAKVLFEGVKL